MGASCSFLTNDFKIQLCLLLHHLRIVAAILCIACNKWDKYYSGLWYGAKWHFSWCQFALAKYLPSILRRQKRFRLVKIPQIGTGLCYTVPQVLWKSASKDVELLFRYWWNPKGFTGWWCVLIEQPLSTKSFVSGQNTAKRHRLLWCAPQGAMEGYQVKSVRCFSLLAEPEGIYWSKVFLLVQLLFEKAIPTDQNNANSYRLVFYGPPRYYWRALVKIVRCSL